MKFKKPENENYCGTIVKINNLIDLSNCDNIQGTNIFGNHVIISNDVKLEDVGVFFPAETQLSIEYASENNLFRHNELNKDTFVKGYIEDNRRIKAITMRQNKSCGLFMSLESLSSYCDIKDFNIGDSFDEIKGSKICNKFIIQRKKIKSLNKNKQYVKKSKIIHGQFNFHKDTLQLGKNMHVIKENDFISISYKIHGTSAIISKVLCKKKLNYFYKLLKLFKINVVDKIYDNLYSSRKVIKNDDMNPKYIKHFYDIDIWGVVNNQLKEYLDDGMTIYAEIVGFLPSGKFIQKQYDYGCLPNTHDVYIYRITYTNPTGKVFEFSYKQIIDWCKERNLKHVLELYYGKAIDFFNENKHILKSDKKVQFSRDLLEVLIEKYLEEDCWMCKNKVPAEGIVVRKECNDFKAFKLKSFRLIQAHPSYGDAELIDIEEEN